jgi:hypothetical protein
MMMMMMIIIIIIIDEKWVGKDLEASDLAWSKYCTAICLKRLRKPKTSIRIAGVPAATRTEDLQNTNLEYYHYTSLLSFRLCTKPEGSTNLELILSKMNRVHIFKTCLFVIQFNIIFKSTTKFSKYFLLFSSFD